MADMTRLLNSAITIGFYNIAGTLSSTQQTITYNIGSVSYDQESLNISALLDWDTVEFLKTFGIVFKETFNNNIGTTTIPGWTITNTGTGAITRDTNIKHGTMLITNPLITDSSYVKKNILIPRREFVTYSSVRYGANFKLYSYVKNLVAVGSSPLAKIAAYRADPGVSETDRTLLAATRTSADPIEIPLALSAETYASKQQDYFIHLRVGNYAEIAGQRLSAIILFTFPGNDTPTSDEIPFVSHYGNHDMSKEGLVVSFDVSDGTTTRKYVFTGCSATITEATAAGDDVQASISFKYRSMSVGEVWA
jgi:hypothetical protein